MSGGAAADVRRVRVEASGSYDVLVGPGLLGRVGELARAASAGEGVPLDGGCLLVSDSHVGPLYARPVRASLEGAGFTVAYHEMPAGERSKSLEEYGRALGAAAQAGLTRRGLVVALGGGVVGDLAGFVAATYMRGCALAQAATSLLAMVDSSVGGKTAVDLPQGKNLAGAFHQPVLVVCDLDVLDTLPDEYMADGMGEVVKYGLLADPALLGRLGGGLRPEDLADVVGRCVSIKRDVVQADERESGARKLLNLGHTVGHAAELLSGYDMSHGRAVAAGCAVMTRACAAQGLCAPDVVAPVERACAALGLPDTVPYDAGQIARAAMSDKKRVGGELDAVVVRALGRCEVERMDMGRFESLVGGGLR